MYNSPFIYGNTVSTLAFTNREQDVLKLKNNLLGGINTMIIAPRRWGKSSLVEKVIRDLNLKNKSHKTVIIDLFSIGSEQEFLETFAREVIKASNPRWQEWIKSCRHLFKQLLPRVSIGIDPLNDFSIGFDWKELKKHSDEILNLPEVISRKRGNKMIICLDEFQNLSSFSDYEMFEKRMRAVWQRQKSVTYCLYGSKRHMMRDIFNNPSKPFYRFGDIMMLPKIKTSKWVPFICRSFEGSGKSITEADAELIATCMKDHSWYVQQLAHYTWNLTPKKASLTVINKALEELISANTPLYQKEIETISNTQLNLLKAVTKGESRFTSASVMLQYFLGTPRNVSKNKTILMNLDLIDEMDGKYQFLDPAFELWFKKQYFGESYLLPVN